MVDFAMFLGLNWTGFPGNFLSYLHNGGVSATILVTE